MPSALAILARRFFRRTFPLVNVSSTFSISRETTPFLVLFFAPFLEPFLAALVVVFAAAFFLTVFFFAMGSHLV